MGIKAPLGMLSTSNRKVTMEDECSSRYTYFAPVRLTNNVFVRTLIIISLLSWNVQFTRSFNIDTNYSIVYSGAKGSYYGWTVKSYMRQQTPWILIGAPRAQTRQSGVTRGGTVIRCVAGIPQSCQEIIFDPTGADFSFNGNIMQQADDKSNQWFGHTISVSGTDGNIIMACAPRYVYYSSNFLRREPVGTCFMSTDHLQTFKEISPCRTGKWGYHRQGHCQAGFSASLTKSGQKAYIGSVGSWYWQGQVFVDDITSGRNIAKTREGPPSDDDSYMGYATATGEFDGKSGEDLVVGVPRGNNLTGKVMLLDQNLNLLQELRAGLADDATNKMSDQIGSYFGYSVTVADLDANGLDDVIVGAPFYNELKDTKPSAYETGRVYIFYQETRGRFTRTSILNGQKPRGRFGMAISSIGDINLDGYQDLVVGAPYDGPKDRGAIYIFNGGKKGIIEKHTQVIMAEDISLSLLQFGWSLHGGIDLDRNKYPDLVIGAYNSDNAVSLRARPIITTHIDLKLEPEILSLEDQSCSLIDGTLVACTVATICVKYEGIGSPPELDLDIEIKLDVGKTYNTRAYVLGNEGHSKSKEIVRLVSQNSWCKSSYIYLKKELRDKLTPIMIQVSVNLNEQNFAYQTLKPILDSLTPSQVKKPLHILKNCGSDNICIPNLSLVSVAPTVPFYKLGGNRGDRTLTVHVTVLNQLEDAFEAQVLIYVPRGVDFINVDLESDPNNIVPPGGRISCSIKELPQSSTGGTLQSGVQNDPRLPLIKMIDNLIEGAGLRGIGTRFPPNFTISARERAVEMLVGNFESIISCDVGNPLTQGAKVEFDARFYPTALDAILKSGHMSMDFLVLLNSTNPENESTMADNAKLISIPVETESDLVLLGASIPDQIVFPREIGEPNTYINETNIGPHVIHVYEVINKGLTSITSAEMTILWPSYIRKNNKRLLYLMEKPMINENKKSNAADSKNVICQVFNQDDINPLGLKIDRFERLKAIANSTLIASDRITQIIEDSVSEDENYDFRGDNPNPTNTGDHFYAASRNKRLAIQDSDVFPNFLIDSFIDPHKHIGQRDTHPYLKQANSRKLDENLDEKAPNFREEHYLDEINCDAKNCTIIKCLLGKFESGDSVSIHLRARVWVETLIKEQLETVTVSSKALLKITEVPYSIDPDSIPFKKALVSTYLVSQYAEPQGRKVEVWVIILAITAGIFILGLIGLCLWRFGFFLRKRPPKLNAETSKGIDDG